MHSMMWGTDFGQPQKYYICLFSQVPTFIKEARGA